MRRPRPPDDVGCLHYRYCQVDCCRADYHLHLPRLRHLLLHRLQCHRVILCCFVVLCYLVVLCCSAGLY